MNDETIDSDNIGMIQIFHESKFLHDVQLVFIIQLVIDDSVVFDLTLPNLSAHKSERSELSAAGLT